MFLESAQAGLKVDIAGLGPSVGLIVLECRN